MSTSATNPLSPGTHSIDVNGVTQRYHVHGTGPVCLAHSGGPGVFWEYMRMPAVEQHLTMVYVEPIGTGDSGRLETHPHGYTRDRYAQALDSLIDHLALPKVYLLGHSHGGFVAQHYALRHADRLTGIILYGSAPVTGAEHMAEAIRNVEEFARKNADNPELQKVLDAFQSIPAISNDEEVAVALRGLLPVYFADYWGREEEFASMRAAVSGSHISSLDEHLAPDIIDDRELLGSIAIPTLVIVGRHDFICGVRWAHELNKLIPGSELLILEDSGHFGHLEEPEGFARAIVGFAASMPE
jgi:pimeloyl-ACP methyl ester carboxylesterase